MARSDRYTAHLLSNGLYSVLLSGACGGYSALDGFAITRWTPDPTLDDDGFIIYIRDLDDRAFRRAAGPQSHGFAFEFDGACARFESAWSGIESVLDVAVPAAEQAELRRLTLRNAGSTVRQLDVTTYAQLALNAPGADAAHPAFFKLFVQTAYDPDLAALLAERRPRSPDDRRLVAGHTLVGGAATVEIETDRARFLGRGHGSRWPVAMTCRTPLTGTTGSVLDPVFCLRRAVTLQPGETAVLTAVLTAAADRDGVLRTLRRLNDAAAIDDAITTARTAAAHAGDMLGLPPRWRDQITIIAGSTRLATTVRTPATVAHPIAHGRTWDAAPAPAYAHTVAHGVGRDDLLFPNGWGGFSPDGSEYVIALPRQDNGVRRPPLPWVNVIANEMAGCIVSESGATHTWVGNSRENRITPWSNDPVTDPHGEALYVRDDEEGTFWSPTPGPCPGPGDYETRHGFGTTTFVHESRGLQQEVVIFVPADEPARIARVEIENRGTTRRRLTLYSYAQLVLGTHQADTLGHVETRLDTDAGIILAVQRDRAAASGRVTVAASVGNGALSWTADRREFIGQHGSVAAPAAVAAGTLGGRAGAGMDACAVLARSIDIGPGDSIACAFVLGEAADEAGALSLARRFADIDAIDAALDAARTVWAARLSTVQIRTPSPAIDIMVNGWLAYQNLSCRMWARSAFYQSGGAFGFRDQLQDASALLYMDPSITRRQILLHAAHQFVEGDVLHWWHPPESRGIRTRFSDDLLWLPYITAFYIARTGDAGILDETVPYLTAAQLEPGTDETLLVPAPSGTSGTLYDHCCRALDRSLTCGAHGLPLIGVGDWNDGMNRVGRDGRGESVWLGFFLYDILRDFIPVCDRYGDTLRRDSYASYRQHLGLALNDGGWDGDWYRRAFYDNGEPLGSALSDECRIDALAQAWAVLSGAAPVDRAAHALDALERHLVSEDDGIIRLLAPPFDITANDPGYIKGYLPGVRENGGQYTHGVLWAVRALAEHGRAERAATLLEMLTPVMHGSSADRAARYCVEPYVVAADVYGVEPHVGRGGWTWYTGSAGWMLRVALESVLGINIRHGTELALRPCIPSAWPGFTVSIRLADGTKYVLDVERAAGRSSIAVDGAAAVEVDPQADGSLLIPLARGGRKHRVSVRLGTAVGPRYVPR